MKQSHAFSADIRQDHDNDDEIDLSSLFRTLWRGKL